MDKTKLYVGLATLSATIGAVGNKFGIIFWAIILLTGAMIIDFISGMLASAKESIEHPENKDMGLRSRKGALGIIKKVGYMLIVLVALAVDFMIFSILPNIGISVPFETFFGMVTIAWFVLNECLSIIENAGRMGVKHIPKFLTKAIAVLKNKVEDAGEKGDEDNGESDR